MKWRLSGGKVGEGAEVGGGVEGCIVRRWRLRAAKAYKGGGSRKLSWLKT
jgi:hypothetical protein